MQQLVCDLPQSQQREHSKSVQAQQQGLNARISELRTKTAKKAGQKQTRYKTAEKQNQQQKQAQKQAQNQQQKQAQNPAQAETEKQWCWEASESVADEVLDRWLDGKTLEQVLRMTEQLGQTAGSVGSMQGCVRLRGPLLQSFATGHERRGLHLNQVLKEARAISSKTRATVHAFVTDPNNHFCVHRQTRFPDRKSFQDALQARGHKGIGSLQTWRLYGKQKLKHRAPLLDGYHALVSKMLKGAQDVTLNKRLYLIWKLPEYCTAFVVFFSALYWGCLGRWCRWC